MKKIFAVVLVSMMSLGAFAQHEIGVVFGGLNGLSYKYWFSDNLAVQADLAVGLSSVPVAMPGTGVINKNWGIYDFTLNPELLYHIDLAYNFKFYLGGGVNIGMLSDLKNTNPNGISGKLGVNGNIGFCLRAKNAPVSFAFDFRPGYGFGFTDADPSVASLHFFDWKLGAAVRYCL